MKSHSISKFLGVDAGGTFTDFVLISSEGWRIHKVLSTPDNPAKAILQGITEMRLMDEVRKGDIYIVHGSTVATNAALERKGARTAYIANKGFKDVLTIGRQTRQELYNLKPKVIEPPVPAELCLEVNCRRDAQATVLEPLSEQDISDLIGQLNELKPEAVAINLLFSFLNDDEEKQVEEALKEHYFVSRSSKILPKYKEYERGIATWLNASLGPKVQQYMHSLMSETQACPISIMQSSGGTMAIDQAAVSAVNLLLSGPAGGLSAIRTIGQACAFDKIISFDMGGTSTDVALMDGDFRLTDEGKINHWPVAIPMLDMGTIGAGGGSIAWLDKGGMLHVGPESAGSFPGPACYGNGGEQPTVTDANVVLGRLRPEAFLAGRMTLDADASHRVIVKLAHELGMTAIELAEGIIALAEQQMVQALHAISVQRGYDPGHFVLCCFGGAGGMHVCSLAEQMKIDRAIVPLNSGVLSALGMLSAPKQRQFTQTQICAWAEHDATILENEFLRLETEGKAALIQEGVRAEDISTIRSLDLRYVGQSFTINVEYNANAQEAFVKQHTKQYGHELPLAIELVNICVSLKAPAQISELPRLDRATQKIAQTKVSLPLDDCSASVIEVSMIERASLQPGDEINGPAIITEEVSTTWLKPNWKANIDEFGNLLLTNEK